MKNPRRAGGVKSGSAFETSLAGLYVKVHRGLLDTWIAKEPRYLAAYVHILASADFATGKVNLSSVQRQMHDHYSRSTWRYFVQRLHRDGFLADLQVLNEGERVGKVQWGVATQIHQHYAVLHGEKPSPGISNPYNSPASSQATNQQDAVTDDKNPTSVTSQQSASAPVSIDTDVDVSPLSSRERLVEALGPDFLATLLAERPARAAWCDLPSATVEQLVARARASSGRFPTVLRRLLDEAAHVARPEPQDVPRAAATADRPQATSGADLLDPSAPLEGRGRRSWKN